PVIAIASRDDFSRVYICTRIGDIRCLELEQQAGEWVEKSIPRMLYQMQAPELNSLFFAQNAGLLAIGHLSAGLAVLDEANEKPLWSSHPDTGNATDANTWLVAMDADGENMFACSAMSGHNYLVALDPKTGLERWPRYYFGAQVRVTALSALPSGKGLLVALVEQDKFSYSDVGRLVLFNASLSEFIWECGFDEPVSAVCADHKKPRCVVSEGFNGKLHVINTENGNLLAAGLTLNAFVNQISLTEGRYIAAALQDGHLAFVQYQP
ncbi:MAG: hypothetical protein WCK35_30045, partial [Chloroflexota bacterium]